MMNYKETLFFVGKCLTISHEEHNRKTVEHEIKSGTIDWDSVVKLSTAHYVFPALYCNLKRANFLHYLPEELVNYMKHITDLNRERNIQIIEQAKEINDLLLANNITPIFLKGTGNLLEGLYEDVAERMVGDIDFIFSENEYSRAIEILTNNGFSKVHKTTFDFPSFKHYPRLQKENKIAAVEIHKELLLEKYADEFNFTVVEKDSQLINNIRVLSFKNQLALSIIATQVNDDGFYYNAISLRNGYDAFLLSKKTVVETAFDRFKKLKKPLTCFIATCYEVFNKPSSLSYKSTLETEKYLSLFNQYTTNETLRNKKHKKIYRKHFIQKRVVLIYKAISNKTYRDWLIKRISDKTWQREKLIQLGIRKTKPNL